MLLGASTYVVNETVANNIKEQDKKILETITVLSWAHRGDT